MCDFIKKAFQKMVCKARLTIHPGIVLGHHSTLRLASQLCRDNFSPGTEWEEKWQGFDGTNRLLVDDPTREVPGMNLLRKRVGALKSFPHQGW